MFRIDPRSQPRVKADRSSLIQEFSSSSNWKCSFVSSDMIWKKSARGEKVRLRFDVFLCSDLFRLADWNSRMVIPIYQIIIAKRCSTQSRTANAMAETIRPKFSFERSHLEKNPIKSKISSNEEKWKRKLYAFNKHLKREKERFSSSTNESRDEEFHHDIWVSTACLRTKRLWSSTQFFNRWMIWRRNGWIWWIGRFVKYFKHFKLVMRIA